MNQPGGSSMMNRRWSARGPLPQTPRPIWLAAGHQTATAARGRSAPAARIELARRCIARSRIDGRDGDGRSMCRPGPGARALVVSVAPSSASSRAQRRALSSPHMALPSTSIQSWVGGPGVAAEPTRHRSGDPRQHSQSHAQAGEETSRPHPIQLSIIIHG